MVKLEHKTLPVVDLGAFLNGSDEERQKIASNVDEICRSIGFLIIENHCVPSNVREIAWSSAQDFFVSTPQNKREAQSDEVSCPRGYLPIEGETLAKTLGEDTPPDRKETFSSGPLSAPEGHNENDDFHFFYGPNIWPKKPLDFQKNWTDY